MADDFTTEDLAKGGQVAQSGIDAAAEQPTVAKAKPAARRAVRSKAQELKVELSEDDVDRIADALVDKMDQRGAFDAPPEPVAVPAGAGPAPETSEPPQAPRKTTFAERFRSR